jgi:hypothetical protein
MLNQLGWAALFGVPVGIFGRQADDDAGRRLRRAMAAHGIATSLDLTGSASSLAEIFVDAEGERAIYMAAGATAETRPEHVRRDHADFIARARRLTTEISQLPLDTTLAALELAHASGLSTVVDLDVLPSDALATLGDRATFEKVLRAADLLKPTAAAARELFPGVQDPGELARRVRETYGPEARGDHRRGRRLARLRRGRKPSRARLSREARRRFDGGGRCVPRRLSRGRSPRARADRCGAPRQCVRGGVCRAGRCVSGRAGDARRAGRRALRRREAEGSALGGLRGAGRGGRADREIGSFGEGGGGPRAPAPGRRVLEVAVRELARLAERHDGVSLLAAAELIEASEADGGRVHVTGVGKPEHVARYAASLLASTGIPRPSSTRPRRSTGASARSCPATS